MSKRILLGCYEIPGWGGAATCHYQLFERLQRDGFDVAYVNLVHEGDELFLRYQFGDNFGNPRALDNVHTCMLKESAWGSQPALARLIESLAPDLVVAFGFIATVVLKAAAPHLPVVFITAGSRRVQGLIESGAVRDFMGFRRSVECGIAFPAPLVCREREAAEVCDLIVMHSPHVRLAFEYFFPQHAGKIYANTISVADLIYAEAERFQELRRPFSERDIDLIFVASSWDRREKNYPLVREIGARCNGFNMHVVGGVEQARFPASYHGVITQRAELYALLGRSKTIVCPSLIDAAPGVLFEASVMGCNVVASPNCGNWQLCNPELVANECAAAAFLTAIGRSLTRVYDDNRARFAGGYQDLADTIGVL
jgi:glycosyltransferase involved in cell wall biosynthesis